MKVSAVKVSAVKIRKCTDGRRSSGRAPSRRPLLMTIAVAAALALGMGACSSDADTTAAPETTSAVSAETTIAAADSTAGETTPLPESTTATSEADSTPTAPSMSSPVVLTATAVGNVALGADAGSALSGFTAMFGPPATDTGWGPQESPCDNMGSRSRYVSWNTFQAFFSTGPTEYTTGPGDHLSAYQLLDAAFDDGPGPPQDRFRLSDGTPAVGRTLAELQAWDPSVQRFNSEIEGPTWTTGVGAEELSGSLSSATEGDPERSSTIRAGLFCID